MPEPCPTYPDAICPNCRSTNVLPVDSSNMILKCKKCGFEGERDLFWTRSDE
jgi:ribosomal protein L37AE/L43A